MENTVMKKIMSAAKDENIDKSFEIFPLSRNNYYSITPPIDLSSSLSNYKDDAEEEDEDTIPEEENGNFLYDSDNYNYYYDEEEEDGNNNNNNNSNNTNNHTMWEDDILANIYSPQIDNERKISSSEEKILKSLFRTFNTYINIYNTNILSYKETAQRLEKIFSTVIDTIQNTFFEIITILSKFISEDDKKNIHRNYEPLLKPIRDVYKIYIIILFYRLNKVKAYLNTLEYDLKRYGQLMLKGIWIAYHSHKLGELPDTEIILNDGIYTRIINEKQLQIYFIYQKIITSLEDVSWLFRPFFDTR